MFLNPWYLQPGGEGAQPSKAPSPPSSEEREGSYSPSPAPSLMSCGSHGSGEAGLTGGGVSKQQLSSIQAALRPGWTVHATKEGRLYYCNVCMRKPSHVTGTSGWLPPQSSWDGGGTGVPFGWEAAVDKEGRTYYVNHINKTSTYEDPRKWGSVEAEETPEPREVTLERHPELGFGFVAGSEKPVIVRFVTGGGPSVDKLMPGDQILTINGEDVARAPRDHVIQLVRNCRETVSLVVCQPPLDNSSSRKSALLSAAKKAKLKSNPSRVRFAESVDINGSPLFNPTSHSALTSSDSVVPLMPNVLKVFLENGQTKSFKYDSSTTVQDVLDSLQAKLGLTAMGIFSLVVEHVKSLKRNKLTLLNPRDTLSKIASRPGAHNLRCLFRVTFVPKDAYELLRKDSVALEYLFVQCCNDVVQERFAPELKYEVALRLAALHLYQHAVASGLASGNKVTVKGVEKECGLERFIPISLVDSIKKKELRKLLGHFLKLNQNLVANGQKSLTGLQAKLHYLKIISELPSYGAKCFSTTMSDSSNETVILVSQKFGVSQIDSMRNTVPMNLCDIEELHHVEVTKEDEVTRRVNLHLKDPDKESIILLLEERDAEELVLVLQGYFALLTENILHVQHIRLPNEEPAPPYCGEHSVRSQGWNYPRSGDNTAHPDHSVDLGAHPPYHPPPPGFKIPSPQAPLVGSDSGSGSDGDTSMVSNGEPGNLDKNKNITNEDNANLTASPYSTFGGRYSKSAGGPASILKKRGEERLEAKNEEVIRRVVEMQHILQSTGQYLTDGETTDAESVLTDKSLTGSERSSNYGTLKHSDSLLLLTQDPEDEEEEYDVTEPVQDLTETKMELSKQNGGPGNPAKSMLKHSDSSFGLHSPDSFNDDVQMLLRKFRENPTLNENIKERNLVLDPDLIDLTMIPPPMTPDEDGPSGRMFPVPTSAVSTPPTPFADRESLEAELLAIEREIGSIKLARQLERLRDPEEISITSLTMPDLVETDGPTLAALRHLKSDDIDSFIANMAVPPPPSRAKLVYKQSSPILELTTEDISAFIIPPPPGQGNPGGSMPNTEREVQEMKVSREVKDLRNHKPNRDSPKVATLQERISLLKGQEVSGGKDMALSLVKDKFGYPIIEKKSPHQDQSQRSKEKLDEKPSSSNIPKGGVQSKREIFMRHISSPDMHKPFIRVETSEIPPPPPPRSSLPKQFSSSTLGRKSTPVRPPSGLVKSSSQDDIMLNSAPVHKVHVKAMASKLNSKISTSIEDLDTKRSPSSPSKMSMTSSSDSISSCASVNTVKSVSPAEENPPSLPPRPSPVRANPRPPLPPVAPVASVVSPNIPEIGSKLVSNSPFKTGQISPIKPAVNGYSELSPPPLHIPSSPKPILPSRVSKPISPTKPSPGRALPAPPAPPGTSPGTVRPAAPTPPSSPRPGRISHPSPSRASPSPLTQRRSSEHTIPLKAPPSTERLSLGRKLPVPPPSSSPKSSLGYSHSNGLSSPRLSSRYSNNPPSAGSSPKPILKKNGQINGHVNGHIFNGLHNDVFTNSDFDPDDSLEGTSVDEPDLDIDAQKHRERLLVFKKAESVVSQVNQHLQDSQALCFSSDKLRQNEEKYLKSRDLLTTEARQFVTASKLFVKSATESEDQLIECLNHCVHMIDRIGNISRDCAVYSVTPSQTVNLIAKVQDVAKTYLQTLQAASMAIGRDMNDPSMNILMKKATALAGVLTTLMRSLRVFS